MRCLLVLAICLSTTLVHAKGEVRVSSPSESRREPTRAERAVGYRMFGGYLGATVGSVAVGAAFMTGSDAAPAAMPAVALPMTMAGLHTLGSFAERREWNARAGSALAGMYPGFGYGAFLGAMAATTADLRGRARRGTILGLGAVFSVLTMGLFSRHIGRSLKNMTGLLYVLPLVASLVVLPYALSRNKPEVFGWAVVTGGAVALSIAAFSHEF